MKNSHLFLSIALSSLAAIFNSCAQAPLADRKPAFSLEDAPSDSPCQVLDKEVREIRKLTDERSAHTVEKRTSLIEKIQGLFSNCLATQDTFNSAELSALTELFVDIKGDLEEVCSDHYKGAIQDTNLSKFDRSADIKANQPPSPDFIRTQCQLLGIDPKSN